MNAVEVRKLGKRYGATLALEDVSFSIGEGVVFGVLGANGCGKSTLLRLLATLERPSAGSIAIWGQDVATAPRTARRLVGYVPEVYQPLRGLTVGEHLEYLAACHALRGRERRAAVEAMLSLVDLESCRDRDVLELSRGQRQRLALASALVHDPALLLLDEPFAGLDAVAREEMVEVLKELRVMGKAVVLASHNVAEVARLCDAVGLLHRGRLLAVGSLGEVLGDGQQAERRVTVEVVSGGERAEALLRVIPEVQAISREGNLLRLDVQAEDEVLPHLLERLIAGGLRIRHFAAGSAQADVELARALQELAA